MRLITITSGWGLHRWTWGLMPRTVIEFVAEDVIKDVFIQVSTRLTKQGENDLRLNVTLLRFTTKRP